MANSHSPLNQSILLIILYFLVVLIYVLGPDVAPHRSASLVSRVHHQIVFHVLSLADLSAFRSPLEVATLVVDVHYTGRKAIIPGGVATR